MGGSSPSSSVLLGHGGGGSHAMVNKVPNIEVIRSGKRKADLLLALIDWIYIDI